MTKLIIQRDQTGATGRDVIEYPAGITPTEILMREMPEGIDPESTQIFVGLTRMILGESEELFKPLCENDTLLVIKEAKGVVAAVSAFAFTVVGLIVTGGLAPKLPGNVGQRKDSPNNNLQAQTNIARPYQAYPLVFGSPRVYPDLGGEAISQYIDNQKIVNQFMCVGIGTFDITEIRAGETPITNFQGSSTNIIEPVNRDAVVPSLTVGFATNEVDGQELPGTNEGAEGTTYNVVENQEIQYTARGGTFTCFIDKDAQSDALKAAFDAATGSYQVSVSYATANGTNPQTGSGPMQTMVLDGTNTFYTITISGFTGEIDPFLEYTGPTKIVEKLGASVGPIKTRVQSDELWIDIIFQRGLKGTADFELRVDQLDGPGGNVIGGTTEIFTWSYTENTLDQQFRTYKAVLSTKAYYQFEVRRTNESNESANDPDQAKLETVTSIQFFTNRSFGNVTLLEVEVPATINATSLRENQINLSLTSKLLTYDGSNVVTTPVASRKFADALLHLYVDFYGLDANTLDLDELYAIQNKLDAIDPRLATFDFTFDDIDVSLDERLDTILQVARCYKWLDGDVYRFARDEKRDFEATIIGRRDITAEDDREYSLSYNPQLLESFDSVKVEYVEQTTNKKAYIFRTFDSSGNVIDGQSVNPKSMELAGCQEEFNAINRAELEMRKLIYQRYQLTDTLEQSAMLLDRGDMILYAEQYNTPSDFTDGEILAVNGNIATTSESIDFSSGEQLQVHYTIEDGSQVGPFNITEVPGELFKFECSDLSQAFVRDSVLGNLIQTGSRYVISTSTELEAARWTVTEKEAKGSKVQVNFINYDERVYGFDS